MSKIYTSKKDESIVRHILDEGLGIKKKPKYYALRLSFALSLHISTHPDEELDRIAEQGAEYDFEQVTGASSNTSKIDFTDSFRALLSIYHGENLFYDELRFQKYLQRHIRRGLREIYNSWSPTHDLHEYLYQELFSDVLIKYEDTNNIQTQLYNALREINIQAEIKEVIKGPRILRFLTYLFDVNDLKHLENKTEIVAFSLGLQKQGIFLNRTKEPKVIGIDVPRHRDTWEKISGSKQKKWIIETEARYPLPLCIGVTVLGEPYIIDLAEAPHIFIGGTTGSGKSVCVHSMILSILLNNNDYQKKICFIDTKKVEFTQYSKIGNHLYYNVITEASEGLEVLKNLIYEMETRETELARLGFNTLIDAIKADKLNKPFIIVFIEEFADLLMSSNQIEENVIKLAQKGRASGIHLVLATQRPDAATFTGLLRTNIPTRIALTVQKSSDSKIILDETGAEKLLGKGDMLVKPIGDETVRVHGIHISADDISNCIKSLKNI